MPYEMSLPLLNAVSLEVPKTPHISKPPNLYITSSVSFTRLRNFSVWRVRMTEHDEIPEVKTESLMDKISEKLHGDGGSSPSHADFENKSPVKPSSPPPQSSMKSRIYRLFGREKPVHKVLGGGKPADVFLWRNKKISASVLGGATAVYAFFELLEYHLITLVCHISILALAIMFLWSNVSAFINKSPPRIPEVQLPEDLFLQIAAEKLEYCKVYILSALLNRKNITILSNEAGFVRRLMAWCPYGK